MSTAAITRQRLRNHQLAVHDFTRPDEVVAWLGAVQAQDYAGAKWALGLRLPAHLDADIERAFTCGEIIRTHVMRPTWHFVTPRDIRWMLALTAPRVKATMGYYDRQLELDGAVFRKSARVIEKALLGEEHLTRAEIAASLREAGIAAEGQRGSHLLMRAELDALICSGPRRGKQLTYALLEERVAPTGRLDHDAALIELARRYFTSHGPAQPRDFAWWSGLTLRDARQALDELSRDLVRQNIDGKAYWSASTVSPRRTGPTVAYLLPNYDEYGIAYKDRSALFGDAGALVNIYRELSYPHFLMIDGALRGVWRRVAGKDATAVTVRAFSALTRREQGAVRSAAHSYARFLGVPITLDFS